MRLYRVRLTAELNESFRQLLKFNAISETQILKHRVNLEPQPTKRKTLVPPFIIDIDGTLLHTIFRIKEKEQSIVVPYALRLLKELSDLHFRNN